MTTVVSAFHYSPGAPVLTGEAGSLANLLKVVLTEGFGSVLFDSLVVAGELATGIVNVGHNFNNMYGIMGPVVEVSGSDIEALNRRWRITVVSDTTLTFACPGVPDQVSAVGAAVKHPSLGWTAPFEQDNILVFKADNPEGHYYQLLDTNNAPVLYGRLVMQGPTTGSPTWGSGYIRKSIADDSVVRSWRIIGNDRAFWLAIQDGTYNNLIFIGQATSLLAGDTDLHLLQLSAATDEPPSLCAFQQSEAYYGGDGPLRGRSMAHMVQTGGFGNWCALGTGGSDLLVSLPHNSIHALQRGMVAIGGSLPVSPIHIAEVASSVAALRGILPGIFQSLVYTEQAFEGGVSLPGRVLYPVWASQGGDSAYRSRNNGSATVHGPAFIDIVGPWA